MPSGRSPGCRAARIAAFDAGSARQLRELLTAVAVYATGGRKALKDSATRRRAPRRFACSSSSADGLTHGVFSRRLCAPGRFSCSRPAVDSAPIRASLPSAVRKLAGVAAIAAAGFLMLRGALPLAIPLAVFGLSLVGRSSGLGLGGPFGSA